MKMSPGKKEMVSKKNKEQKGQLKNIGDDLKTEDNPKEDKHECKHCLQRFDANTLALYHQLECPKRQYKCIYFNCETGSMLLQQLIRHLENVHHYKMYLRNSMVTTQPEHHIYSLIVYGEIFNCNIHVLDETNGRVITIKTYSGREASKLFKYKAVLQSTRHKEKKEEKHFDVCNSRNINRRVVENRIIIPAEEIGKYGPYKITVEISKK